jgi:formylglycine-generating enzyme required for sulfatase activity
MMGSENGYADEKPVHRVRISRAFEMGKYEVTQAQWQAVMGSNPSLFKGANLPVESASWNDAQQFIQKLNARNDGYIYRLPTEAEWEYACRASSTGDYAGNLDAMAWYDKNSGGKTHPVGQKQPNDWGLHDMHGNVLEWCQDWYDDNYYAQSQNVDPRGSATGSFRALRGGSWYRGARYCRSAIRHRLTPDFSLNRLGFRLVRTRR